MALLLDKGYLHKELVLGIRPEDISYGQMEKETYQAIITVIEILGSEAILYCDLYGEQIIAKLNTASKFNIGDAISLQFNMAKAHFFDKETEQRIF